MADAVRNLAQRSAQAAKETTAKIEGAIGNTARGVGLSEKVSLVLNDIVIKARQVDELAAEVAVASREQTQGITQINGAVGQMDKVTQNNAANAEESAAAAEELSAQANTMKHSVSELMQLVGEKLSDSTGVVPSHSSGKSSVPQRSAPAKNGRGSAVRSTRAPLPVAPSQARKEIPLEDAFKDF